MKSRDKFNLGRKLGTAPLPRIPKLGEAQAGDGFAFAGEELLHQPFLMGLEGVDLVRLGGDQRIEGREAIGDFLLFLKSG